MRERRLGKAARMLTEPVDWSITPLMVSMRPSWAYSDLSLKVSLMAGICSNALSFEPYWRMRPSSWFSVMEKYTYITELSDTVVSGCGMDELTNAPTR